MPERYLRKLSDLMEQYQKALSERNIEKALEAGHAYYSTYRNGDLWEEDREKIQNDIYRALTNDTE